MVFRLEAYDHLALLLVYIHDTRVKRSEVRCKLACRRIFDLGPLVSIHYSVYKVGCRCFLTIPALLLFFLMTTVTSASMFSTCMSFPVAVLMVRTPHIWIIFKCFINKCFHRLICITGNSSKKLNACCR